MNGHGFYVAWNFAQRMHCADPRIRRQYIMDVAAKKGVPVSMIGSRHLRPGSFIHLGHKEPEFRNHVAPLLSSLELDGKIDQLLLKMKNGNTNERGNVQLGGGFAAENHELGLDTVTAPQPTKEHGGTS
jgi:hypothetical protein